MFNSSLVFIFITFDQKQFQEKEGCRNRTQTHTQLTFKVILAHLAKSASLHAIAVISACQSIRASTVLTGIVAGGVVVAGKLS